jgi:DNA-binding winged helix-turn-helix (wHTH) protein/TolB-like protein
LTPERRVYCFEDYRVDSRKRVLTRAGEVVPLTPKSLAILLVLLEDAGQVVEKADLVRRVWADQFVSEGNLTQNIWALRKAFDERATEGRFVMTVPGRGYRFVAPVEVSFPADTGAFPIQPMPPAEPSRLAVRPVPPIPTAAPPPGARGSWRRLRFVLGGALLAAGAVVAVSMHRGSGAPASAPRPSGPAARLPSVAVLGLRNLSEGGAGEALGPALAAMLTTELAAGGGARVVSSDNLAQARRLLALPDAAQPDRAALTRLKELVGADRVVVGSYLSMGTRGGKAQLRLDLRILGVPDGDTLTAVSATGSEADLFDLVSRAGAELRRALGSG